MNKLLLLLLLLLLWEVVHIEVLLYLQIELQQKEPFL